MSNNGPSKSSQLERSPPPLSGAFLIKFDIKVGYSINWKRSAPGVQLDESVEYKSLPSGLHSVKEDLVYFIQDQYAGLSAFVNAPAAESERNASLVAVGVLVPLSNARLGRGWLHAQKLRELAQALAHDVTKTELLEEFWEEHKAKSEEEAHAIDENDPSNSEPQISSKFSHSRARALSNLTDAPPSDQSLPPFHPALSITEFVETFGPLIFPLWRAALLRKRILIIAPVPVRRICEFIFDISVLSSIPSSLSELLSEETEKLHRIRPFFQIGLHDIALLEKEAKVIEEAAEERSGEDAEEGYGPFGFLACTTDEVIVTKKNLYDILVEVPGIPENEPEEREWPKIKTSDGTEIKASQRDLRRWKIFYNELNRARRSEGAYHDDESETEAINTDEDDDDETHLLRRSTTTLAPDDPGYDDKLIDPMTWSQLAYSGFMWWASAGERDAALADEQEKDRHVLGHLSDFISPSSTSPSTSRASGRHSMSSSILGEHAGLHTSIIAYFHRLTSQVISTMAEIVETADDELNDDDESAEKQTVSVSSEDIARMGLDVWSRGDADFAKDMIRMYFRRDAIVKGGTIECCGIKIC